MRIIVPLKQRKGRILLEREGETKTGIIIMRYCRALC